MPTHNGFALRESMDQIKKEYGTDVDYMRVRAYPFCARDSRLVASHERVYVVEQEPRRAIGVAC